jgi:hypothetical protein
MWRACRGEALARLTWLAFDQATLKLCWKIEITRRAGGERYQILLDANTGEAVVRRRLTGLSQ